MADDFGGARPKTRTFERNIDISDLNRGNNSCQIKTSRDAGDKLRNLTETSFNYNKQNGQMNETVDGNSNNLLQKTHKGVKQKLRKSVNTDIKSLNLESGDGTKETDINSRKHVMNGQELCETAENKRLQEIGKLSKQREQEYLSARERWKKSGLALRKYIAEKLGFKQDKVKPGDAVAMTFGKGRKRSPHDMSDRKWKTKQEKLTSLGRISTDSDNTVRLEDGEKFRSESKASLKEKNNLERSRSESSKDGVPRSRSFLRYLGLKKEKNSPKRGQSGMKLSHSFEMSSSDAWPESSTDTCKSDWSADNTLTNHREGNSVWTNQKCQSTQTHCVPSGMCDKGTKTEGVCGRKHKSRTHRNTKVSVTSKESKKTKHKDGLEKSESKSSRWKQKKQGPANKWVGLLDDEIQTSSNDEFEFVLDPEHDEVVRRVKERNPHRLSEQQGSHTSDNENRGSKEISDSTVEAMLGLHHAVRYLPESFRSRLQAVQSTTDGQSQTTLDAPSSYHPGETTASNNQNDQRETTSIQSEIGDSLKLDSFGKKKREKRPDVKKLLKDKENWRKKTDKEVERPRNSSDYVFDTIEDYERNLEVSLEDPFHVRSNSDADLCSGLMDLVREIDIPFIDEDGETRFNSLENDKKSVGVDTGLDILNSNSSTLANSSKDFANDTSDTNFNSLVSLEDDPDYPGMRTLNSSFNRLLGDDSDSDTTSDSSVLNDFLQRSRSDETRSRSKSSDESLEADDEFECECDHCQLLRQHSYGTHNLDLLPPRLCSEDVGFSYDLDLSTGSSAGLQSDTESHRGWGHVDEYDFLLDRPSNDLDWMLIDSRPLSAMLEDVIQQMLAVQPELLNEQAAPPAPQIVIENLPTLTLTSTHIVQHPSCPICLCSCEIEEVMTLLPCQHIFHPICIQAWLVKSGTCPVCRGRISR